MSLGLCQFWPAFHNLTICTLSFGKPCSLVSWCLAVALVLSFQALFVLVFDVCARLCFAKMEHTGRFRLPIPAYLPSWLQNYHVPRVRFKSQCFFRVLKSSSSASANPASLSFENPTDGVAGFWVGLQFRTSPLADVLL